MRIERRIFLNTAILGAGEVTGQAANLAFVVLFARRFGVEVLGWYSFAMALGTVLAPFVGLGGGTYATREMARDPARGVAVLEALRPIQQGSGLVVWLVMGLVALLMDLGPPERLLVVIVGAYHVLMRLASLYLTPAVARGRMLGAAVLGGGHKILFASLAAVMIALGFDAPVAVLAMPVAALCSLLAVRFSVIDERQSLSAAAGSVRRADILLASLPFLGTALLLVIYYRGGLLLLTALRGEVATGHFAAADRLLIPILMITGTFTTAVFAPLSRLVNEPERALELSRRCLRLVLLLTIPLAAALAIFSTDVTMLVFGRQWHDAARVLVLLAPLAVLRSVCALWAAQCVAFGAERRMAVVRTWSVVTFFVIATPAIVLWGAAGLAVACVASEALQAFRLQRLLAEHSRHAMNWQLVRGPVIAVTCAAAAATLVQTVNFPGRLALVIAVMVTVTVALKGVRGNDLRYFLAILRNNAGTTPRDTDPSDRGPSAMRGRP